MRFVQSNINEFTPSMSYLILMLAAQSAQETERLHMWQVILANSVFVICNISYNKHRTDSTTQEYSLKRENIVFACNQQKIYY
jgi:hypothetical protein